MNFSKTSLRPAEDKILREGKEFFDAVLEMNPDDVIRRTKRIDHLAVNVARLAGENLRLETSPHAKQLVYAAFKGIYDLMEGIQIAHSLDETVDILKHPSTHVVLQRASIDLDSPSFNNMTSGFREQGAYLEISNEKHLQLGENYLSAGRQGSGCPLANRNKPLPYFNKCTDKIVDIYEVAYREGLPRNLGQLVMQNCRSLVGYTPFRDPKTITK